MKFEGVSYRMTLILFQVRLNFACYPVYLREWLRVFPRESFLFLKTEEYAEDMKTTLNQVFKFLDLGISTFYHGFN